MAKLIPSAVLLAIVLALNVEDASAVTRACGLDPVANTTDVLCAAPSGPCTATLVEVSASIDIPDGVPCTFDIGGRALLIDRAIETTGQSGTLSGQLKFINVGDTTITDRGKLKAHGDFVKPSGFIINGGFVSITSVGSITHDGVIDVTGDGAGTIVLEAAGDINVINGASLTGNGISSFLDEGERFADGGTLDLISSGGSVTVGGDTSLRGANQATGGTMTIEAARDVALNRAVDITGGGGDGGALEVAAGDNIVITKRIDGSSRGGGGFGGTIVLEAGEDGPGDLVPGGGVDVIGTVLKLQGSEVDEFGGDGGELDITAFGPIRFFGSGVAVRVDAATSFDGFGGVVTLDTTDLQPHRITALDGDIEIAGIISARGGSIDSNGGELSASAGANLTITADVDLSGKSSGGDFAVDAGGDMLLDGILTLDATDTEGDGGLLEAIAGSAANGTLTIGGTLLARSGATSNGSPSMDLEACTIVVDQNAKIDGRGGTTLGGLSGGADIALVSRQPMQLGANSQYLAGPAGSVTLTYPAGAVPVVGAGVVFTPGRTDFAAPTDGLFPNCPVCGDGTLQLGETCDPGIEACCNASCDAYTCATPTTTPTPTISATPTVTATVTATATVTPVPTATATTTSTPLPTITVTLTPITTPTATATLLPTSTPTVTATPVPTATATATATSVPTMTPTVTPTVTATATPTVTVTATATLVPTKTPTVTPTAIATPTATPVVTATATATATPTVVPTTTPTVTPTATAIPTATVPSTPTPVLTPGVLRITDPADAKAADGCQRQIEKSGARLVATGLKRLSKCVGAALVCIQSKPGDTKCLDKAVLRCAKGAGKQPGDEAKFRSNMAKKCSGVALADLLGPQGLGYDLAVAACEADFGVTIDDAGAVAECLVRQHRCRLEQMFAAQVPRAGELLGVLGLPQPPASCLPDFGGAGVDIGDPEGDGRALGKCTKQIATVGAQIVNRRLKTLARCVTGTFSCLQKKPDDPKCLARADAKCASALARTPSAMAKLGVKIDKKCGAARLDFAVVAAAIGGNVDALAAACAAVGVDPVLTLGDYKTCMFRQHECVVEDLVRLQAPRVAEILALVGQPFGQPFCASP